MSPTFLGRDLYAPVAAFLADGGSLAEVGPLIPRDGVRVPAIPVPVIERGLVRALVLALDQFGNATLNVRASALPAAGFAFGDRIELDVVDGRYFALRSPTFADVPSGELVVFDDSSGWAALALTRGSFAGLTGVRRNDPVSLRATL